jgi:hypothetical protein
MEASKPWVLRVFISWSGPATRRLADALHDLLPMVIQPLDVFVSSQDIGKGKRWRSEIDAHLGGSSFGIICLSRDNLDAPWIHFEAGALAKALPDKEEPAVCTYLLDIEYADVKNPLSEFEHTLATRDDTRRLVDTISRASGKLTERPLAKEPLDSLFDAFWPKLEAHIEEAKKLITAKDPVRSTDDMVRETLDIVRGLATRDPWGRKSYSLSELEGLMAAEPQQAGGFLYPSGTLPFSGSLTAFDRVIRANELARAEAFRADALARAKEHAARSEAARERAQTKTDDDPEKK